MIRAYACYTKVYGLQAGCTETVELESGHAVWVPRVQRRDTGNVAPLFTDGFDAPEDDVFEFSRIHAGAFNECGEYGPGKLDGRNAS